VQFVFGTLFGTENIGFPSCCGQTSRGVKVKAFMLEFVSLILQIVICFRIAIYKRKNNQVQPFSLRNIVLSEIDQQSLSSFCLNISILLVVAFIVVLNIIAKNFKIFIIHTSPSYFHFLESLNELYPSFVSLFTLAAFCSRNTSLRKSILREIKNIISLRNM